MLLKKLIRDLVLLDISKLKNLDWFPKIGLEEGIAQTYDCYVKLIFNSCKKQTLQ